MNTLTIQHSASFSVLPVLLSGLVACADVADAEPDELEDSTPVLAAQAGVAGAFPHADLYSWSMDPSSSRQRTDVIMKPLSSHLCFLSGVRGDFGGNRSLVLLHHSTIDYTAYASTIGSVGSTGTLLNDSGATWQLGGWQDTVKGNSIGAEAICVPRSDFSLDPNDVLALSERFVAGVSADGAISCSEPASAPTWPGDAVAYLAGVQGQFEGGGESAEVINGASVTEPSVVRIATERCRVHSEAHAYSLFIGIPGQTATHRTEEFSVSAGSGKSRKKAMLETSKGVCYLTRVSGNLDGAEESIHVYPEVTDKGLEYWMLGAKAGGGSAYGSARCVYYNQHDVSPEAFCNPNVAGGELCI